ncbi:MAG: translocation/assembly module TamB domain-containing protein [Gammaproteobacteria bacterium]|nr:translocation/assembly module TamB domain-containing protein [Gammaproteobacteria bacterium]MCP5136318.1 translocation/assembly module TamB domain-containing protein [Gammaproteobacteria bacterium]
MSLHQRLAGLRRRPWLALSAGLLIVALLLAGLVLWLLSTESGLRFAWRQLDPMLRAAGVQVRAVEGVLLGTPSLRDVRVLTGPTDGPTDGPDDGRIAIDRVQLEPIWGALWHGELRLAHVTLKTLEVTLDGTASEPLDLENLPVPELPEIRLPIRLRIDALRVASLRIQQRGERLFEGHLAAVLSAAEPGLTLTSLSVTGTPWNVQARGFLPFTGDGALQWQTDWTSTDPNQPLAGELTLSGTLAKVGFEHRLVEPFELDARGVLEPGFGNAQPWNPGFRLALNWVDGALPVPDDGIRVSAGSAQLQGGLLQFAVDLKTALTVAGGATLPLTLSAQGRPNVLEVERLSIVDGDTSAVLSGTVSWRDTLTAALDVVLNDLDPGRWVTDWPGRVGARFHVDAQAGKGSQAIRARLRIDALSGRLRGADIAGSGQIAWQDGALGFDALTLNSGRNRLELNGQLSGLAASAPHLDLRGSLKLPEPGTLLPGASGYLDTDFKALGTWPRLGLDLKTRGEAITWPEAGLALGKIEADWRMGTGSERSQDTLSANIEIDQMRVGGTGIDRLGAQLQGNLDAHRLALAMTLPIGSDTVTLDARAAGAVKAHDGMWAGQITNLNLASKGLGEWRSPSPVALSFAGDQASLERICLNQNESALCGAGRWRKGTGLRADLETRELPLKRVIRAADALAGFEMPALVADVGALLNARARIDGERIDVDVAPMKGRLRWRDPPLDFPETLPFTVGEARYRQQHGHGEVKAVVELDGRAHLDVALSHGSKRDPEAVSGTLQAKSDDLAWLAATLPGVREVRGDLSLAATLGGRLSAPNLTADGRLRVKSATLADLGTQIQDAELRVHATPDGQGIRLDGELPLVAPAQGDRAGRTGRLTLSGEVLVDGPQLDLHLGGDTVPVLRLADVYMDARPDLHFHQAGQQRSLSGEVFVPTVDIVIASAPASTLKVSPDEVIIGETPDAGAPLAVEAAPAPEPPPAGVAADVTVRLGDDVRIDAFDLKARLGGRVRVRLDKGREHAEGRIDVREGRYKAYGQALTLARGHLMFAGPPDNPSLDLRATRKSADGQVTAHVDVTGNLHAPRLTVGSTPSSSDADALSYLLTGRPLSEAGKGGKIDVYAAALGLGIDKGAPQLAAIRREFGLDELGIDTGSGIEATSVKLGKYLNPDLFIGYSLNVFDNTGAVLARLRLAEGLDLEGRSARTQSVDLIYKIESD